MRRLALATALLSCACAHRVRVPDGARPWVEVRSPHFEVVADLSEEETRRFALQLEQVHAALMAGSWHAVGPPPRTTRVLVLADDAAMQAFFRKGFLGFATNDALDAPLLVIHGEQSPSEVPVLKHELAHAVDNGFLLRQPRWLSEGLASYLETLHVDADGRGAVIGEINQVRMAAARKIPRFDFAAVLAAGISIHERPDREVEDFYAQSWLLVHMLVNEQRPQFEAFLQRLARSEDPDQAFAAAFPGLTPAQLAERAGPYSQRGQFLKVRVPLPPFQGELVARAVPPGETLRVRAELEWLAARVHGGEGLRARALESARRAFAAVPGDPLALALLHAQAPPSDERRLADLRALVAASPQDVRGWTLLAEALAGKADLALERLAALDKAFALGPDDPRALAALAWSRAAQGRRQEAIDLAQKAVRLAPGNPGVLDTYAVTLAQAGRCADAMKLERRALEVVPDGAGPEVASALRARIAELEAHCGPAGAVHAEEPGLPPPAPPPDPTPGPPPPAAALRPTERTCKEPAPRVPLGAEVKEGARAAVRYTVDRRGRISNVVGGPKVPKPLVQALAAWLAGCRVVLPPGAVVPAELEEEFTFARAPR